MMGRTKYIAYLGLCIGLCACQSDEPIVNDDASRIYVAAEVESAAIQSRTPYWLSEPTADNPLLVDVWAATPTEENNSGDGSSNTDGDASDSGSDETDYSKIIFKNTGADGSKEKNKIVALHTTARFTNGSAQLLNQAVYPFGKKVYFVGMHPQGWTTESGDDEGKSAFYSFDGNDDVMFAPHIVGEYGNAGEWPKFKFKHLLTWLRVEFVADNEAVSTAWGKVTNITIKSRSHVSVKLNQAYPSTKMHNVTGASVNFSDEVDMDFYQTGTDNKFPSEGYEVPGPLTGTGLSSYIQEKAYVLCEPVYATDEENEYTITITTEKRMVNVGIDLMKDTTNKFTGTTMGYQFTVLLHFKMGGKISVSAVATDWVNGGMGTADVGSGNITTTNN